MRQGNLTKLLQKLKIANLLVNKKSDSHNEITWNLIVPLVFDYFAK